MMAHQYYLQFVCDRWGSIYYLVQHGDTSLYFIDCLHLFILGLTTCAWSVVFLPITGVPDLRFSTYASCDNMCQICGLFYIFLPMQAVTTCARYAEWYISTYASLCQALPTCARYANCNISTYASCARLWWPVPRSMQSVKYLPMPAVPGSPSFIFLPMPACARLWRPVPGTRIVIFLPIMPAVTACAGYTKW